jgi:hypothetical protein
MKKEMKYILVLAVFLLMQPMSIYAKDKLATCTYANYIHIGQKQVKLNFTLYDDGSVGKPVKKGESYNNDGFYWTYSKNFDSEYSGALYNSSTKKLSASCPKIYICQPSTGQVEVYSHSVACSDGDDPQALSGDLTVENQTPVAQDKSKTYCTRNKSLRNESYNVDVKFYLDSNGNKRFSVMRSGTNIGADAAYNELVSVGSYTFGIASQDVSKFYSSSCSTVALYFDLNDTSSSITITSSKPSDVNNGSIDVNNASNDNSQDTTNGTSGKEVENTFNDSCISCGNGTLKDIPSALPQFVRNIILLLQILVPIILIGLGIYDFVRAVIASDEKMMKESQNRFIKRIIAAVLVFFVVAMVKAVFSLIPGESTLSCIPCFVSSKNSCDSEYTCSWNS